MPVRLTHNRRRSPMAHSPKARGVHPDARAFGATSNSSRYTSSPTIPIVWRSVYHQSTSPGIPARSHTGLRPEDDWSQWDRLWLPLSPWASDGFSLLVRRLPGWPQAMWGHRCSYRVTNAFGDSQRTPRSAVDLECSSLQGQPTAREFQSPLHVEEARVYSM